MSNIIQGLSLSLLILLSTCPALSMETQKDKEEIITVLQHNIGSYGDYRRIREPSILPDADIAAPLWKVIDKERDKLLKDYFRKIACLAPDIITFQEIYGLDMEAEKKGVRKYLKKYLYKNYVLVEAALMKNIKKTGGTAIILYKKNKFNEIGFHSGPRRAYVHLENKETKRDILVASAHLAGFELSGPDNDSITGDGKKELMELIKIMNGLGTSSTLKIIGVDVNSPPTKLKYITKMNTGVTITSPRTAHLWDAGYKTAYCLNVSHMPDPDYKTADCLDGSHMSDPDYKIADCLDGSHMPRPTAINYLCEEGMTLDYILAKIDGPEYKSNVDGPEYEIHFKDDFLKSKDLAPYKLKNLSIDEVPLTAKKAKPLPIVPFGDHHPLFYEIHLNEKE